MGQAPFTAPAGHSGHDIKRFTDYRSQLTQLCIRERQKEGEGEREKPVNKLIDSGEAKKSLAGGEEGKHFVIYTLGI